MNKFKIKLWIALTALGFVGVLSLLLSAIPLDSLSTEVTSVMSPEALRLLLLVNPTLFLILATTIGVLFYDKANLSIPIFEKILRKPNAKKFSLRTIIIDGVVLGFLAGVAIISVAALFNPYLPQELTESNLASLNLFTRILYGGITEELLLRFGLMSLIAWIILKINNKLTPLAYWLAIFLSSIAFALGHLPALLQVVAEPSLVTYLYIIIANSIGGLIFGYAYYRKGLESAFIAHSIAHITMIALTLIIL